MNKQDIISRLKDFPYSCEEYWVITGSAMVLYGIREQTHDIDMGCTSAMADKLVSEGYSYQLKDQFMEEQKKLTLEGNIVISVGLFGHSGDQEVWENMDEGTLTKTKEMLDDMHKRKSKRQINGVESYMDT